MAAPGLSRIATLQGAPAGCARNVELLRESSGGRVGLAAPLQRGLGRGAPVAQFAQFGLELLHGLFCARERQLVIVECLRQSLDLVLEADRKWWPIAPARRPHLKGIVVYVADGTVVRIRGIDPDGPWEENDDGYVDAPVTAPLNDAEIARRLPTLSIRVGDPRPHVRGKIREYVVL